MFKYNGLSSYRTKTGGVLTLMFIIFLIILFALRLSSRKKGELMTYTQKQVLSHDLLNVTTASNSTNQFMIALNLYDNFGRTYNLSYFEVYVNVRQYEGELENLRTVIMQPCTQEHWSKGIRGGGRYYCLPLNQKFGLEGQAFENIRKDIQIFIDKCRNQTRAEDSQCAPDVEEVLKGKTFISNILYANYFLNLDDKNFKESFLDQTYVYFDETTQAIMNLQFSKFVVETDESYLSPISETQTTSEQGAFSFKNPQTHYVNLLSADHQSYVLITVQRAGQTTKVKRSDDKLVDILAYIGGFSTVLLAVIQLVANLYNQYAYQLELSSNLYSNNYQEPDNQSQNAKNSKDNNNKQNQPTSINLFTFLKKIFGCPQSDQVQNNRNELFRQLDIQQMLRKINIIQNTLLRLVEHPNIKLQLKEINRYRVQEAQLFRQMFQLVQEGKTEDSKKQKKPEKAETRSEQYKGGPLEIVLDTNCKISQNQLIQQKFEDYQNHNSQKQIDQRDDFNNIIAGQSLPPRKKAQNSEANQNNGSNQPNNNPQNNNRNRRRNL